MKKLYKFLISLHFFVGIGALAGGLAAILNPQEPMGMSNVYLVNSPFSNFLVPGIILFTIIGLGSIAASVGLIKKIKYHRYISAVFSIALGIWIVVQCIMLEIINVLHVIFFIFALIGIVLSVIILKD